MHLVVKMKGISYVMKGLRSLVSPRFMTIYYCYAKAVVTKKQNSKIPKKLCL